MKVQDTDIAYIIKGEDGNMEPEAITKRLFAYTSMMTGVEVDKIIEIAQIMTQVQEKIMELQKIEERLRKMGFGPTSS